MTIFFCLCPLWLFHMWPYEFAIGGIWYGSSLWLVELEIIFISTSCHFVWKFEWSCKEQVVCTKAYIRMCFQCKWNLILMCAQDVWWKIAKAKDFSSLSFCVHWWTCEELKMKRKLSNQCLLKLHPQQLISSTYTSITFPNLQNWGQNVALMISKVDAHRFCFICFLSLKVWNWVVVKVFWLLDLVNMYLG